MAKNTVEYFSSALGNGVINNAASEATLQELLRAFQDQADRNEVDDDDLVDTVKSTSKVLKSSTQVLKSFASGIKNTALAGKNFVTMIAQGENRLSVYGKFLQDDVIKKLPIVGESLGGFTSILVSGIEALESWNDDLKRANVLGAAFGHSLIEFKLTAVRLGVSNDELIDLIANNNDKIVAFGAGTVTDGIRKFTNLSERIFLDTSYVSDELDRIGLTSFQQNELLVDFLFASRRSKKIQSGEYDQTGKEFLHYAKNLDTLTKLTGKNREQRLKAISVATNDVSYQLRVAKYSDKQQARLELALNGFAMLFGEQGAELFKAKELNITTMNDVALALQIAMGPDFEKAIGTVQNLAKSSASDADFEKSLNNILGDQLQNAKVAVENLRPIIKGAVSGNEDSKRIVRALGPAMDYLIKQGDMAADVKNNYLKQIQKIRDEQKKTDAFTAILRKFQRAIMKAYNAFMKNIMPVLKQLANEFDIAMLPEKINAFRDQLITLGKKTLPYVKNFFANLNNPEFDDLMMDTFQKMTKFLQLTIKEFFQGSIQSATPKWLRTFLQWIGFFDDLELISAEKRRLREQVGNNLTRFVSPGMGRTAEEQAIAGTRVPVKIGDTTYYVSRQFARDSKGFFTGYENPYAADSPITRRQFGRANEKEAILAMREQMAERKELAADDASKFGGYNLLQREAMIEYLRSRGGNVSRRKSGYGILNAFSDPEIFKNAGPNTLSLIQELAKNPAVIKLQNEMREKYPNTFTGLRTGTLGQLGSLFANFGSGTPVALHGEEMVGTPEIVADAINASNQISIRDVVNRLNSNINTMIAIAKADVVLERSKLLAMN